MPKINFKQIGFGTISLALIILFNSSCKNNKTSTEGNNKEIVKSDSIDLRSLSADSLLSLYFQEDDNCDLIRKYLELAIEKGSEEALIYKASHMMVGDYCYSQDTTTAIRIFEGFIGENYFQPYYFLGEHYLRHRQIAKGLDYIDKAARLEGKYGYTSFALGESFLKGQTWMIAEPAKIGLPRDTIMALEYFKISGKKGNTDAHRFLAHYYAGLDYYGNKKVKIGNESLDSVKKYLVLCLKGEDDPDATGDSPKMSCEKLWKELFPNEEIPK